jgi:uncharacterized protein (DUF736 family)
MKEYVNSGAFFANTVKTNPKAPDYQGDILVDLKALGIGEGKYSLKLAGWKKTSAKGTSFLSLSVSLKEDKPAQTRQVPEAEDDPF